MDILDLLYFTGEQLRKLITDYFDEGYSIVLFPDFERRIIQANIKIMVGNEYEIMYQYDLKQLQQVNESCLSDFVTFPIKEILDDLLELT